MTLRELMTAKLESPDATERLHARNRLTSLDAGDPEPQIAAMPPPADNPALWLTDDEQSAIAVASPIWCLYRTVSPARGACRPWRCWAARGSSCGGSHTDDAHCQRCLYPDLRSS